MPIWWGENQEGYPGENIAFASEQGTSLHFLIIEPGSTGDDNFVKAIKYHENQRSEVIKTERIGYCEVEKRNITEEKTFQASDIFHYLKNTDIFCFQDFFEEVCRFLEFVQMAIEDNCIADHGFAVVRILGVDGLINFMSCFVAVLIGKSIADSLQKQNVWIFSVPFIQFFKKFIPLGGCLQNSDNVRDDDIRLRIDKCHSLIE